jgi:hypothetical protein
MILNFLYQKNIYVCAIDYIISFRNLNSSDILTIFHRNMAMSAEFENLKTTYTKPLIT